MLVRRYILYYVHRRKFFSTDIPVFGTPILNIYYSYYLQCIYVIYIPVHVIVYTYYTPYTHARWYILYYILMLPRMSYLPIYVYNILYTRESVIHVCLLMPTRRRRVYMYIYMYICPLYIIYLLTLRIIYAAMKINYL